MTGSKRCKSRRPIRESVQMFLCLPPRPRTEKTPRTLPLAAQGRERGPARGCGRPRDLRPPARPGPRRQRADQAAAERRHRPARTWARMVGRRDHRPLRPHARRLHVGRDRPKGYGHAPDRRRRLRRLPRVRRPYHPTDRGRRCLRLPGRRADPPSRTRGWAPRWCARRSSAPQRRRCAWPCAAAAAARRLPPRPWGVDPLSRPDRPASALPAPRHQPSARHGGRQARAVQVQAPPHRPPAHRPGRGSDRGGQSEGRRLASREAIDAAPLRVHTVPTDNSPQAGRPEHPAHLRRRLDRRPGPVQTRPAPPHHGTKI